MKKFRMPSAFSILFLIITIIAILTWIVPAGTYDYVDDTAASLEPIPGTYTQTAQNPQGLWEVLRAPIQRDGDYRVYSCNRRLFRAGYRYGRH